jgi:hypothetical protein
MKYKGIEVKKKPILWRFLPWLYQYTAQALYPNIYVSSEVFANLQPKNPNPKCLAILEHEKKHLERQAKIGLFPFGVKYLFLPKFRLKEELLAIKEGMKVYKENGLKFDIDRSAYFLSSWLYLWMTSFENAKKELEKIWDQLP